MPSSQRPRSSASVCSIAAMTRSHAASQRSGGTPSSASSASKRARVGCQRRTRRCIACRATQSIELAMNQRADMTAGLRHPVELRPLRRRCRRSALGACFTGCVGRRRLPLRRQAAQLLSAAPARYDWRAADAARRLRTLGLHCAPQHAQHRAAARLARPVDLFAFLGCHVARADADSRFARVTATYSKRAALARTALVAPATRSSDRSDRRHAPSALTGASTMPPSRPGNARPAQQLAILAAHPAMQCRHDDGVELQALGRVNRHHLDARLAAGRAPCEQTLQLLLEARHVFEVAGDFDLLQPREKASASSRSCSAHQRRRPTERVPGALDPDRAAASGRARRAPPAGLHTCAQAHAAVVGSGLRRTDRLRRPSDAVRFDRRRASLRRQRVQIRAA